jgi:hypothetical protein
MIAVPNPATWSDLAEHLLEQALGQIRDGVDAIPAMSAALAALRVEAGELPADELDDVALSDEGSDGVCICPPALLKRGGFRGGCPTHGRRWEEQA